MSNRSDIQGLIPDTHRDLIEAVPRGFLRSAVTGAVLLGAFGGALLTFVMPGWLAVAVPALIFAGHVFYKRRSDKLFDDRIAAFQSRGLDWETDEDS